jgi:hypothetical protein
MMEVAPSVGFADTSPEVCPSGEEQPYRSSLACGGGGSARSDEAEGA